jgi:succinyl-CoA synthetase alpha subunit
MMGPDCGTALLNGAPLGFANAVARGDIGIVAAAGTGLQEVSSIVSNSGAGVSQALGAGGRDVQKEVGGIMFLEALAALRDDPATRVIALVSKPPHATVLARIGQAAAGIGKPAVAVFLGADPAAVAAHGLTPAATLEEAALLAVALSQGRAVEDVRAALRSRETEIEQEALRCAALAAPAQKYVRGLFTGGALCAEAQAIFRELAVPETYSNVPLPSTALLEDPWRSRGHALVDLGEDAFTVGRLHPMIDGALRNRRILEEARAAETALILLDVVLGYGANPDPAGELAPALVEAAHRAAEAGRRLKVACSVTGTRQDPQDRQKVEAALVTAGARVFPSNAAASRFAACVARALGDR